ncbi:hypothetical protein COX97_04825 [Candidatus Pacearchaeota archaeon CG_4_10_14_0_2_um_filter_05_32_18]|nr:MAG: hypothetical protein COX97_04825 [Candidatus Pacearchaeota archaeon CG_4_10_14_0_2_um_filter_05_32_18]
MNKKDLFLVIVISLVIALTSSLITYFVLADNFIKEPIEIDTNDLNCKDVTSCLSNENIVINQLLTNLLEDKGMSWFYGAANFEGQTRFITLSVSDGDINGAGGSSSYGVEILRDSVNIAIPTKFNYLAGEGNAYLCLDSEGRLFRSNIICS